MLKTSAALRRRRIYWQGVNSLTSCLSSHQERWLAKIKWVYAKEQRCWKDDDDGHLDVYTYVRRSIFRIFFRIKKPCAQWFVNHDILHSLLLGWQMLLHEQKQENVPYQKAFLDKRLVLSLPIYTSVCVW